MALELRDTGPGRGRNSSSSPPLSASPSPPPYLRSFGSSYEAWSESLITAFWRLPPSHRALVVLACIAGWVLLVLVLVYSHRFFAWLAPVAKAWRQQPAGWLLIFVLICVTAFPPVVGSLGSFLACRNFFSARVDRLVGSDHRFVALGQVLRHDGIWYLTGIRFCPLPFSLSNGFLATIPSITPLSFAISTALSSPKLLVHIFIGSRLAALAEEGDSMSAGDKAINYLSMFIGAAIGLIVGLVIYRRTIARAEQLAAESAEADAEAAAAAEQGEAGYQDSDATLLDPEDAAAVMLDDELALWDTEGQTDPYEDDDPKTGQPLKGRSGGSSTY
ncbi:hypothetical protein HIM_06944 [Hirsutella minnesotensis 3608]|uniref:Golgi apparatus membrane protein TVP38 n=1 Tax=Hirsutella minnesotensis 3608 TaxID=1043627 RepID=A0A0F7ZIC8_9HYPO|nr:hypothetical protein HIM_06944 [Hirsutella minnesotensis 3608]